MLMKHIVESRATYFDLGLVWLVKFDSFTIVLMYSGNVATKLPEIFYVKCMQSRYCKFLEVSRKNARDK